jgi:hypothetical protein
MEEYESAFKKFLNEEGEDHSDPQYWINRVQQDRNQHIEAGIVDPNEEPDEDLDQFDLLYSAYEEAISFDAPQETTNELERMWVEYRKKLDKR